MYRNIIKKLLGEWVALVVILAMVLGPLALATSRGLEAQERIAIAAGLAELPICAPGDITDGLTGKQGIHACDHCLPQSDALPALLQDAPVRFIPRELQTRLQSGLVIAAQFSLPPATGPPVA